MNSADLEGADLHGIQCQNCENGAIGFRGANLKNANLSDSYLQGSQFSGANLTNTNFTNAILVSGAGLGPHLPNFEHANMTNTDLQNAQLQHGSQFSVGPSTFYGAYYEGNKPPKLSRPFTVENLGIRKG